MSEQELLDRAVSALNTNLSREKATIGYEDGAPYLTIMGKRFWCVVKPTLTLGDMVNNANNKDKKAHKIYITINATPKML